MKNFDILLEDFESSLKGNKKSKNTVETYKKGVIAFNDFMDSGYKEIHAKEFEGVKEFKDVESLHVERYKEYCDSKNNSARTVNNKLTAVSRFFNNMIIKKVVRYNPVTPVERPEIKRGKPTDSLTSDEVDMLMKAVRGYKTYRTRLHHTIRDYTMIYMFLSLGLRASELSSLKISDVDLNRKVIWFMGKGERMETLPLTDGLIESLQVYLKHRNKLNPKSQHKDILFISSDCGEYTTHGLNRKIKLYVDEAGITKSIHTHSLRHTFALNTYSITKDILGLQKAMRHSSPKTTAIYTEQSDEQVRSIIEANTFSNLSW